MNVPNKFHKTLVETKSVSMYNTQMEFSTGYTDIYHPRPTIMPRKSIFFKCGIISFHVYSTSTPKPLFEIEKPTLTSRLLSWGDDEQNHHFSQIHPYK